MTGVKNNTGSAIVIGGGPAGLMAAEQLALAGASVQLFEAMPTVGRKFLLAGVGGMNITHAEPAALFASRYGARQTALQVSLDEFGAQQLREWIAELGIDTFVGSSGRVFPKNMKAAPLLRAWLHRLREAGVQIHVRHRWLGWSETDTDRDMRVSSGSGTLRFATPSGERNASADVLVLALGGGSWARLGSDGAWVPWLRGRGISVADLQPTNCGFECIWTDYFKTKFAGVPLKGVAASLAGDDGLSETKTGELMVTQYGIEGGLAYTLSAPLREQINRFGYATLLLDLLPDRSMLQLTSALEKDRGATTLSNHLRKTLKLVGAKAALLREVLTTEELANKQILARTIKALPLCLQAARALDEAISTAGGVRFEAMDSRLMIECLPGIFCAGEMLDWEAPTGGYLLTACFATGRRAGAAAVDWLHQCSAS